MANDGIQAFGGYGYIREYEVEKIKRDVKILPIYEGTSEIQRNIISMFRLRSTVRSKGRFYLDMAEAMERLTDECAGPLLARAFRAMNQVIVDARRHKLTRSQHVMFLLADMMTWCEVGGTLGSKAALYQGERERTVSFMQAAARLFAREVLEKVYINGLKISAGCGDALNESVEKLNGLNMGSAMNDNLNDMDLVAAELVK